MIQKTIKYTDLNEQPAEQTAYFHLTAADLIKMDVKRKGGMQAYIKRLAETDDKNEILAIFEEFVRRSYGRRSDDGAKFIKDSHSTDEFLESEAYSQLLLELLADATKAAEFISGLMPASLERDVDRMASGSGKPRTPQEAAALKQSVSEAAIERGSEELGQPTREVYDEDKPAQNAFDNPSPKILTQTEVLEMDSDELKSGLATGKYKLQ